MAWFFFIYIVINHWPLSGFTGMSWIWTAAVKCPGLPHFKVCTGCSTFEVAKLLSQDHQSNALFSTANNEQPIARNVAKTKAVEQAGLYYSRRLWFYGEQCSSLASEYSTVWLTSKELKDERIITWPPLSPGLNPSKNSWALLKHVIYSKVRQ